MSYEKDIPMLDCRTRWIGGGFNGAKPVDTSISRFDKESIKNGLRILDMFSSISCGGLLTILEAGYNVKCYTSVEIDDVSRTSKRSLE